MGVQWDSVLRYGVGVGAGPFLAVEVASAGPWGAAWCQPGHN